MPVKRIWLTAQSETNVDWTCEWECCCGCVWGVWGRNTIICSERGDVHSNGCYTRTRTQAAYSTFGAVNNIANISMSITMSRRSISA